MAVVELFRDEVNKVSRGEVKRVEFVTFVNNPVTGERRTFLAVAGRLTDPNGPVFSEADIDDGLSGILAELTDNERGRSDLEEGLREKPDGVQHESHQDILIYRWPAMTADVEIGVELHRDDRGVFAQTWFISQPEQREIPGLFAPVVRLLRGLAPVHSENPLDF